MCYSLNSVQYTVLNVQYMYIILFCNYIFNYTVYTRTSIYSTSICIFVYYTTWKFTKYIIKFTVFFKYSFLRNANTNSHFLKNEWKVFKLILLIQIIQCSYSNTFERICCQHWMHERALLAAVLARRRTRSDPITSRESNAHWVYMALLWKSANYKVKCSKEIV